MEKKKVEASQKELKVLCVCEGGNVRSVSLAYILKSKGIDALACGVTWNKPETIEYLCQWADKILIAHTNLKERISVNHADKIIDMEIGPDRWGQAMVPDLISLCIFRMRERLKDIISL